MSRWLYKTVGSLVSSHCHACDTQSKKSGLPCHRWKSSSGITAAQVGCAALGAVASLLQPLFGIIFLGLCVASFLRLGGQYCFCHRFLQHTPSKGGVHGFVLHSGHFLRRLGPTLRTKMRHNLNVWAQGLGRGPSSCVFWFTNPSNYSYIHHISQLLHVIEVGNQLIYSLGAPHCPRSFLQIPSTRMNPSNNYELSDYNIIQPITTPMATIHRWIWWSHQYPSISKVFTIVEIPTVDGRNPASPWMVTGKKYLSTGAGFLPSTVLLTAKEFFSNTPISYQIPQFSLWSIARCHTMLNYQYTHLCHSISCVSHYQSNKMSTWVPGKFPIIGDWIAIFHHKIEVLPPRGMIPSIIILSSWYYGMI